MKATMQIYDTNIGTVATDDNKTFMLGKDFTFYKLNGEQLAEMVDTSSINLVSEIKDSLILVVVMICTILISIILYLYKATYVLVDSNFLVSTIILIINIPLHELGHILCLKMFYPKSRIKVGFKFVFIFPAFYVDTSYSYLLPKYKRISVYLAGNFINAIFLLFVIFFFPQYLYFCYILFSNIMVNFIPIIKSDGYYTIKAFFNSINMQKSKVSEYFEDFVRGLLMFFLLKLLTFL